MKLPALVIASMLISSTAYADAIVIGCPLIKMYSESDVGMLLTKARSIISEQEVNQIYSRYVVLKNACQTNSNASQCRACFRYSAQLACPEWSEYQQAWKAAVMAPPFGPWIAASDGFWRRGS